MLWRARWCWNLLPSVSFCFCFARYVSFGHERFRLWLTLFFFWTQMLLPLLRLLQGCWGHWWPKRSFVLRCYSSWIWSLHGLLACRQGCSSKKHWARHGNARSLHLLRLLHLLLLRRCQRSPTLQGTRIWRSWRREDWRALIRLLLEMTDAIFCEVVERVNRCFRPLERPTKIPLSSIHWVYLRKYCRCNQPGWCLRWGWFQREEPWELLSDEMGMSCRLYICQRIVQLNMNLIFIW